jgi:hypothetical protein
MDKSIDAFRPKKFDNETLIIHDFLIPLKQVGCIHLTDEIIDYWQSLEKYDFPLINLSSMCLAIETARFQTEQTEVPIPYAVHIIKMIDMIKYCESMVGGKERINYLKQQLSSLVSNAVRYPEKQADYAVQILKAIVSSNDEFQIGYILHRLDPSLIFNTASGPEFKLCNIGIKVEAKSKLNRTYLGDFNPQPIGLNKEICLRILARDAVKAGALSTAFNHQGTDIAIVSLSHSEFGDIFAAHVFENNLRSDDQENYEFGSAFKDAVKLVNQGKKGVILYSEVITGYCQYTIGAIASEKETVEQSGSELEKKEKDTHIDSKAPNYYYRIVEEARTMEYNKKNEDGHDVTGPYRGFSP